MKGESQNKDDSQNAKIASVVVVFLTVAYGYGILRGDLDNPRPYSLQKTSQGSMAQEPGAIESRLWEDPFEAFEAASNTVVPTNQEWNCATEIGSPIEDDIETHTNSGTPVAILGVMMRGGSYAEDKEARLRMRYAVELALLTKDMGPFDPAHIFTNSICLGGLAHQPSRMTRYAYEWFEAQKYTNHLRVCVLWLNEEDFGDEPMLRLASLLEPIHSLTAPGGEVKFYLVGPTSSDTLKSMVETSQAADPCIAGLRAVARAGAFSILSPEATAVCRNFEDPAGTNFPKQIQFIFATNNPGVFHNWIASDLTEARLIAGELANRMSWPSCSSNNVVVLISEQDSLYGRSLADEWTSAISRNLHIDSNQIWQFSYLRGLDGSKPQARMQQQAPSISSASPEAFVQNAVGRQQEEGQSADGDAQLDYVIRLSQFLKQRDDDLKRTNRGRIVAFGLTGSDVYDKLILLQELRRKFPEAVFFTSDLDASYLTSKQLKSTIGLLVSSGYPLNPTISAGNQQSGPEQFPPFRDDYQTAVFLATEHVVNCEVSNAPSELDAPVLYKAGGLYIIGRHGAVDITGRDKELPRTHRRVTELAVTSCSTILVSVLLLICFVACANGGIRVRRSGINVPNVFKREIQRQIDPPFLGQTTILFAIIVLLAGLFLYFFFWISSQTQEEPSFLLEGMTIWPSECIRLLVVVLSGLFFFVACLRRYRHRRKLWELYFSKGEGDSWKKFCETCNASKERHASLFLEWYPPIKGNDRSVEKDPCIDALGLFCDYLRIANLGCRALRISLFIVLYAALAISLFFFLNDLPLNLMIRGEYSHMFDLVVLFFSILCNLIVLFYVLDATFLTKRLLDYLGRYPTYWPKRPVDKGAREFGLDPKDLDSWLDVDFAAVQTDEIGPLMFWPIVLQLLMLVSRIPYFDEWTWPVSLIVIFGLNFLAAAVAWWIVRRAAENVRKDALMRIDTAVVDARSSNCETYVQNLENLRDKIKNERRGAFARWFQDPTYLAVFVPSGVSGIVSLFGAIWLD
jgi:hypothetical protein